MIGTLLTFFAVGLVTLVVVAIVLSVVGAVFSLAFGLAGFLLFKVAPVVFVGWLALKLLERRRPAGELTAADREWLEGGR
jgi:threonine/homoserine/homoserine lactone efflux protein